MQITLARVILQAGNFAPRDVIQSVSFTLRVISVDGDMRIPADGIMTARRVSAEIGAFSDCVRYDGCRIAL